MVFELRIHTTKKYSKQSLMSIFFFDLSVKNGIIQSLMGIGL